jgi:hypothetical protein
MTTDTQPLLNDYLDDSGLAEELRVSIRTVWRWRAERKGPPCTRLGKKVLYRRSTVKQWLEAREQAQPRGDR